MSEEPTCKAAVLARLLGLSTRRVSQLAAEGVIPKSVNGRYEFMKCNHAYIEYVRGKSATASMAKTKDEILQIDREMKAFKLAQEKGLYILRDEVVNELVKRIVVLKRDLKAVENRLMKYPDAREIVKRGHYNMLVNYSRKSGVFRERANKHEK